MSLWSNSISYSDLVLKYKAKANTFVLGKGSKRLNPVLRLIPVQLYFQILLYSSLA